METHARFCSNKMAQNGPNFLKRKDTLKMLDRMSFEYAFQIV